MTSSPLSRRELLKLIPPGLVALSLSSCGWFPKDWPSYDTSSLEPQLLPIPPLAVDNGNGIELVAASASTEFIPGVPTETWGFSQPYLGPTIMVREGDSVEIRVKNDLEEAITSHWHGLAVPGMVDGGPMNLIAPGETWTPTLDIQQPASFNWYHSHVHGRTGAQVYRGLAGAFIIEDANSDALDLPREYGVDDIPVIIQDRTFLETGELDYDITNGPGGMVFYGATVVVNGAIAPYIEVAPKLIRLRIVNASNGRYFDLSLDDGSSMHLIAADGGFLNEPAEVDTLLVVNGQRREILLDLSGYQAGDEIILRSENRNFDSDDGILPDEFDVLRIRISEEAAESRSVPAVLNDNPDPQALLASVGEVVDRSFALRGGGQINGERFEHGVINHESELGTWERWTCTGPHPFHVHGASFMVLSRSNGLRPEDSVWQDTIFTGGEVELLIRFEHEAPVAAPYMYHCHIMGHEDAGMMGQFTVT